MILLIFIIMIYVYLMYIVKGDISQLEHLVILLMFTGMVIISANEAITSKIQKYIDRCLGLDLKLDEDNCQTDIKQMQYMIQRIKDWIIKDYKSSQCRKWIRWINNKRIIIFSS